MSDFKSRILEFELKKGITKIEIAKIAGVSVRMIQKYAKGEHQPTANVIIKLADYFNVSTDYLLGRTDDDSPFNKGDNE